MYKRLTDVLADCWDKPWAKLPGDQRIAWCEALGVALSEISRNGERWDSYDAQSRQRVVFDYDQGHDPACNRENDAWFNHYAAIHEKERELAEWELMNHQGDPTKAKTRKDELAQLRAELEALKLVTPDAVVTSGALASDNIHVGAGEIAKALPAGVPTTEIITGFKFDNKWADKLRHVEKKNPFLKPALMTPGSRHSATKTRASHLWNPVKLAEILIEREHKPRKAMAAIIGHRFPRWQDEWEAAQLDYDSSEWDDGIEPA
jgi:hypothetical protein